MTRNQPPIETWPEPVFRQFCELMVIRPPESGVYVGPYVYPSIPADRFLRALRSR